MKLHPLHTPEMIGSYVRVSGEYFDAERCTGRTTRLALTYILTALATPHQWVTIRDHYNTELAHRMCADKVRQMCEALGLNHMVFRGTDMRFGVPGNRWRG